MDSLSPWFLTDEFFDETSNLAVYFAILRFFSRERRASATRVKTGASAEIRGRG
jgi:hypothetical protein